VYDAFVVCLKITLVMTSMRHEAGVQAPKAIAGTLLLQAAHQYD
jgi:hypothetical protein